MFLSIKRVVAVLAIFSVTSSVQAVELKSLDQQFSYALGYQFAQQLKSQGVSVQGGVFAAALDDVLQGNKLQMTTQEMGEAFRLAREQMAQAEAEKAQAAFKAGEAFLADNGKKEGIITLPSGLQYQVLKAGEGEVAGESATVTVHYRGSLITGQEFDSSHSRGEPTSFSLGGVVLGFREGISRMRVGGKWKLFIPASMGYGEVGAPGAIGPNETLVFEVELISVKQTEG